MNDDMKKHMMGLLGERIVATLYRGHQIEFAETVFDQHRDLRIDGRNVEVKTQRMWLKHNAFTYRPNQHQKCTSVDQLIFIDTDTGDVYEASPGYKWFRDVAAHGPMIIVPVEQELVCRLGRATASQVAELKQLSTSKYSAAGAV